MLALSSSKTVYLIDFVSLKGFAGLNMALCMILRSKDITLVAHSYQKDGPGGLERFKGAYPVMYFSEKVKNFLDLQKEYSRICGEK